MKMERESARGQIHIHGRRQDGLAGCMVASFAVASRFLGCMLLFASSCCCCMPSELDATVCVRSACYKNSPSSQRHNDSQHFHPCMDWELEESCTLYSHTCQHDDSKYEFRTVRQQFHPHSEM
jgi:hypothetical protein